MLIVCITIRSGAKLIELRFYVSAWYGKTNLTQQKHTFTNQKKCTTQNKHKLAAALQWFTDGGAIRIAVQQILQTWKLRHNSETIRERENRRPHRCMKSSELSNGENRIALRQLLQNRKLRHLWRHNLGSIWKLQKNGSREF